MPKLRLNIVSVEDNTLKERFEVFESEEKFRITESSQAKFKVPKDTALDYDTKYGEDIGRFFVDGELYYGGPIVEVKHGDNFSSILLDSYERFAQEAENAPGTQIYELNPVELFKMGVNKVPGSVLSVGETHADTQTVEIALYNRTPAEIIRSAERLTNLNVFFRADGSVDFKVVGNNYIVGQPNLSTENHKIIEKFDVTPPNPRDWYTHVWTRGIGAGDSQDTLLWCPSPKERDLYDGKYDGVTARYAPNDQWEEGDKRRFGSYESSDFDYKSAGHREASTIAYYLMRENIKIDFRIREEDYFDGDPVTLLDVLRADVPEYGIHDKTFYVNQFTRKASSEGIIYDITLSTRSNYWDLDAGKLQRDNVRYNLNYEGETSEIHYHSGLQPITADDDITWDIRYPNYASEIKAEVTVIARDIREFSGTGDNRTIVTDDCDAGPMNVQINGNWVFLQIGPDVGEFRQTTDIEGVLSPGKNDILITANGSALVELFINSTVLTMAQHD